MPNREALDQWFDKVEQDLGEMNRTYGPDYGPPKPKDYKEQLAATRRENLVQRVSAFLLESDVAM
jgi:hypothetical protein